MHAWERFLDQQEHELGIETVQKWLKTLKVVRFDACNLYLEAKDPFQVMWFEEHIRPKVQGRLFNSNQRQIKVHLSTSSLHLPKNRGRSSKKEAKEEQPPHNKFILNFDELDPTCTLSSFIASETNQLTYQVFCQLADPKIGSAKAAQFNPIYVHGQTGSGKTHLLMGITDMLRQKGLHVVYSRAQTFTDHVVSAIRAGEMSLFRQAYRNSDVLIIDDVHIFSRKGATQEEFFHTFNTLHVAGKQIILSANCSPRDLQLIEPRLVSRFEWGIVLSLELSDKETARKILVQKAAALQFPIHAKVIDFLLDSFSTSKSLCRALEALILRSHLRQNHAQQNTSHLTVLVAKQLIEDLILEDRKSAVTPQDLIQGAAEFFGIKPEDILGKAQTRDYVLPRQLSMHLCRCELKIPYVKIGDLFGKDHSTVMSSVKLIQKYLDAEHSEIASSYRAILKKVKSSKGV